MGFFSSCDHDWVRHENKLNKWPTHKCRKCGKVERCKGYFSVSNLEWQCEKCGQNVDYTKAARD